MRHVFMILVGLVLATPLPVVGSTPLTTTLTVVPTQTHGFKRNFNPYDTSIGQFYSQDFIYEPLWIFNVLNPEQDHPRLATEMTLADDLSSITFHLREGVEWSDGMPFTADDVMFTVDYARAHSDYPITGLSFAEDGGIIESVERLGDHQVRFNLAYPNVLEARSIGELYPLPEHIFSQIDDPRNFSNPNPVATGPFTEVRGFTTMSFRLCRNERFWQNSELEIDCLRFPTYLDNDYLWAAARSGLVDWMGMSFRDPGADFADHHSGNRYWLPPHGNVNLQLNTTRAPFDDLAFRQALSLAIDRDSLLDEATFGLTTPTRYPIGIGAIYEEWFDHERLSEHAWLMQQDQTRARRLLDEAGYVDQNGDGWRQMPDGSQLEFNMAVPASWTDWVNTLLSIESDLRHIGIRARARPTDESQWYRNATDADFDVYIMWTDLETTPYHSYHSMFSSEGMRPGNMNFQALHQYEIPQVSSLLSDFAAAEDPEDQRRIVNDIALLVAEHLPVIPLFSNPTWYQYNDTRFTGWVNEDNPFVRPVVHQGVPERLIHVLNLRPRAAEDQVTER